MFKSAGKPVGEPGANLSKPMRFWGTPLPETSLEGAESVEQKRTGRSLVIPGKCLNYDIKSEMTPPRAPLVRVRVRLRVHVLATSVLLAKEKHFSVPFPGPKKAIVDASRIPTSPSRNDAQGS